MTLKIREMEKLLTEEKRARIEQIIKDGFAPGKILRVDMWPSYDHYGDEMLQINMIISKNMTAEDYRDRFFWLPYLVAEAMGEEMEDFLPMIRPVEEGSEDEYARY